MVMKPTRILLVVSDKGLRIALDAALTTEEFEVVWVGNMYMAMYELGVNHSSPFNLILLDLDCPLESPCDGVRELKSIARALPVVVLTDFPDLAVRVGSVFARVMDKSLVAQPKFFEALREVATPAPETNCKELIPNPMAIH